MSDNWVILLSLALKRCQPLPQLGRTSSGGQGLKCLGGSPPMVLAVGGGRLGGYELTGTAVRQSTCTNHRNRGRTSADRSTKATLMLTVPRSLNKSSTKDLT